jgi:hypothetical protein
MSAPTIAWDTRANKQPQGRECRVYERHGCELPTTCQPIAARSDQDIQWQATIRNVSEGGLAVVLGRRFERGAGLAIELPGTGSRPSETLLTKVMNISPLPDGKWLLGCAFVSRLSEDEVQCVVALARSLQAEKPLAPSSGKSQAPGLVLCDLWFEGTTHDGEQLKLPVRRLFLTGTWPLAAGTKLRLWVGDKSRFPKGICVKVVACRQQAEGWTVSYRPVEPISGRTLRALGFAG